MKRNRIELRRRKQQKRFISRFIGVEYFGTADIIFSQKYFDENKDIFAKTDYSLAADIFNRFIKPTIEDNKKQAKLIINNIAIDFTNQHNEILNRGYSTVEEEIKN